MSYAKIENFGTNMRKNQSIDSAYVYTELQDPFLKQGGNRYTPAGRESMRLMVNKCANAWTPDCDNFTIPWYNQYWINQKDGTITSSEGNLIKQAAEMRFCNPLGCSGTTQLVDPTTINSPAYTTYNTPCQMDCSNWDPSTIDQDPLFMRVLERPIENATLLMNMCHSARRRGINIEGTKLNGVCRILGI